MTLAEGTMPVGLASLGGTTAKDPSCYPFAYGEAHKLQEGDHGQADRHLQEGKFMARCHGHHTSTTMSNKHQHHQSTEINV